jgi:hypothetical protein
MVFWAREGCGHIVDGVDAVDQVDAVDGGRPQFQEKGLRHLAVGCVGSKIDISGLAAGQLGGQPPCIGTGGEAVAAHSGRNDQTR